MSTNEILRRDGGVNKRLAVDSGVVSGDPVLIGKMLGVAETTRDSDGYSTVALPIDFIYDLSVKAVNSAGNSAVAIGDELFYNASATPKINKDANGVFIGYALEAITSGSTATINVGFVIGGTVGRGVGAEKLITADGAITVPTQDTRYTITKAGVAAMTLAAPTVSGILVHIISGTANAHTLTNASPGFNNAGAGGDVGTFGGAIGDGIVLLSYNGIWLVVSKTNVTIA